MQIVLFQLRFFIQRRRRSCGLVEVMDFVQLTEESDDPFKDAEWDGVTILSKIRTISLIASRSLAHRLHVQIFWLPIHLLFDFNIGFA